MDPSGCVLFFIFLSHPKYLNYSNLYKYFSITLLLNLVLYDIWINIYLSNGYIHRYCTRPPRYAYSAKCIGKCSITLKNPGRKTLSNLESMMLILHCIFYSSSTLNTVEQRLLKYALNSTSGSNISFGRARNAIGISICKNI